MKLFAYRLTLARLAGLTLLALAAWPSAGVAEPPEGAGGTDLARRTMHLLRDHCIRCHNAKKTKGQLNLTVRALVLIAVSYTHLTLPTILLV